MHLFVRYLLIVTLLAFAGLRTESRADLTRQEFNLNPTWRFLRIDRPDMDGEYQSPALDDSRWEVVHLPHSVRLEPENASGNRNFQGIAWYRREIEVPATWQGRNVLLRFDGAMQVAELWLNGEPLFTHHGGYIPFVIDLSDRLRLGQRNVIAVKLDNRDNPEVPPGKPQGRTDMTYFGGIYRNVTLTVSNPVSITDALLSPTVGGGGVLVTFPEVGKERAVVRVATEVGNRTTASTETQILTRILAPDGKEVARNVGPLIVPAGNLATLKQDIEVPQPLLWHPYHPHLYTVVSEVLLGKAVTDTQSTRIGIRRIRFDREKGFFINGERLIAIGTNRHQDFPYIGYAAPDSLQYRDVKKLREAGCLSIRSHYPQSPAFMDASDELGMLNIVSNPGWQWYQPGAFDERARAAVRTMVRRDRNRPSVILWEPQLNEATNVTAEFSEAIHRIVHNELPGDQTYTASDHYPSREVAMTFDVTYNASIPKPLWIREWGDGDATDTYYDQQGWNRQRRIWGEAALLRQSSWLTTKMDWCLSPARSGGRLCGMTHWAGIDHQRGYNRNPFLGGFLDVYRIPKYAYWLFASQRPPEVKVPGLTDGPFVFIANQWHLTSTPDVTVFANCEEVRLIQDGKLIAQQKPDAFANLPHPPFTFKGLTYSRGRKQTTADGKSTRWVPGELNAEGLIGGQVVATHVVRAPGIPRRIVFKADNAGPALQANGSDLVMIYAELQDANGQPSPTADDEVRFSIVGPGSIVGDTSIGANPFRAQAGVAFAYVRAGLTPGPIKLRAEVFGLPMAEITLISTPPAKPSL